MNLSTRTNTRHKIRPLSVFTFCGQPIAAPSHAYHLLTKDLPPCLVCQRAHERAAQVLGKRHRKPA